MIRFLLLLCGTLLFAVPASAHLLPAQNATMNIVGRDAYFVISAPASAFAGIDDDRSGGLSVFEISRHSQYIATQFAARFHVSEPGNPVRLLPGWVSTPQTEGVPVDQRYVVVLLRAQFAHAPLRPAIATDLFGTGPGEGQMTLSATQGSTSEVAILTSDTPAHTYFLGAFATFADFVRVGMAHILGGPDHLLFLLTVIVAAAGWRYWLSVVTAFTIAHSITLTLAALGVVRVSPAIVEPGIAASIVAMAALNLMAGNLTSGRLEARGGLRQRVALVFACGLLHGLGFASAIGAMAVDSTHRLATLAGFNIGIELGQFVFLGGLLALGAAVRRLPLENWRRSEGALRLPQLASMTAAALGSIMLVERILPALPHLG
jgi:hydrogenase/urease accessory protein HupE